MDPFYGKNKGVSNYIDSVILYLQKMNFPCMRFKRKNNETIEEFRLRLLTFYLENRDNLCCIESPETLAASLLLPATAPVHIRIHFSKVIGDYIQGKSCSNDYNDEQKVITNARWVSSPSQIALDSTKAFFLLPKNVPVYPHPASFIYTEGACQKIQNIDVLFIGRWENLKGINFLKEIAVFLRNTNLSLGILSDERAVSFCKKNSLTFFNGNLEDKYKLIKNARVIIIPSLFETVSMVGLEALYLSKPIVAWQHLGICEYVSTPWVHPIPYPDIKLFCKKIEEVVKNSRFMTEPYSIERINNYFFNGLVSVLSNNLCDSKSFNIHENNSKNIDARSILEMIKNKSDNSDLLERFQRKWRKFLRDPSLFFKDAIANKSSRRRNHNALDINDVKSVNVMQKSFSSNEGKKVNFNKNIGHIPMDGKITFKETENKPIGMVTALFYPRQMDKGQISELLNMMDSFSDFPYIGRDRLHICTFNADIKDHDVKIFERITPESRKNLSRLSNIILLDAPQNLVTGIRACSPNNRLIYISTKNLQVKDVDCYICVGSQEYSRKYPREIVISSFDNLHIAIRRVIQEASPKSPDVLLPIIGCNHLMKDDFINFDSTRYQGIIWYKRFYMVGFENMSQYYEEFSKHVIHLAVLESVYLTYKNLCEHIENKESSPHELIQKCLENGIVFDVRELKDEKC